MRFVNVFSLFFIFMLSASFASANVVEDTAITAGVKLQLLKEQDLPSTKIEVVTKNKVVNLKGVLDTNLQVDRAITVAASVDKVEGVIVTNLKSRDSDSLPSDAILTAIVKGKIANLYLNKKIDTGYDLQVETTNGNVHVFGTVTLKRDIKAIKETISNLNGVKSVNTNITVSPQIKNLQKSE